MNNMYKVCGFWTGIMAVMFYLGHMNGVALIFLAQTAIFVLLGYLKLTERMYVYIFFVYLTVCFIGFTYYTSFILVPGFE